MNENVARILVVDDEQSMQEFLEIFLRREGFDVVTAGDVDTAIAHLESDEIDLVITDMQMPGKNGLDLLLAARKVSPETILIVITAFGTTDSAIAAMKEGAYDYLTKPFKVDELRIVIEKALEKKILSNENTRLRRELRSHSRDRNIIGHSRAMQEVYELIAQVAETKTNVLVSGESGTGKELVARAVHAASPRASGSFIPVDCGALPVTIIESELFGHEKGAFTGATGAPGLFRMAEGGTLFLDEIGEVPLSVQAKLLRALQEKEIRPVGSSVTVPVDIRVISATHRDLVGMVAEGKFRTDLYYRLNVVRIEVPSLNERREDIPLLVRHFMTKHHKANVRMEGIDDEALEYLMAARWPGNVRELENVVESALALAPGPRLRIRDFSISSGNAAPAAAPPVANLDLSLEAYEHSAIERALEEAQGDVLAAARRLGIGRSTFYRKLTQYRGR